MWWYWKVVKPLRSGYLGHWIMPLKEIVGPWILSLCTLALKWAFCSATCSCHDVLPYHRPKTMEPTDDRLEPPKLQAKITLFYLQVDYLKYCYNNGKMTNRPF